MEAPGVEEPLERHLAWFGAFPAAGRGHLFGGQSLRTVAGMVGVITAVLAGATAGLVAIAASSHSLAAALIAGVVVALAAMAVLIRFQERAYRKAGTRRPLDGPCTPGGRLLQARPSMPACSMP